MNRLWLLLFLASPFSANAQFTQRQFMIDSLRNELSQSGKDTSRVRLLDMISFTYSDIDPNLGIKYALQTKELAEQLKWTPGIAMACSDLGINYNALSEQSRAIYYNLKALSLYRQLNDKNSAAGVMANISLIFLAQSNYTKALEYAFQALKIKDELKDDNATAIIMENIGTIFFEQKNYPKTHEYYTKALKINEKLNDKVGIARNLGNMGLVENANGNYHQALTYHLQALTVNKEHGNKHAMQISLANVGLVYGNLSQYDKALEYQQLALICSEELGHKNSIAVNLGNIGETYFHIVRATGITSPADIPKKLKDNLHKATGYLIRAIALCKEIKYIAPLIEFEQYLSDVYQLSGNYELAYQELKQSLFLKDSLFSEQNRMKLSEMETQRKLDLKDKDIVIKNKQIEIAALEAANHRIERTAFIALTIFFLSLMAVAARRFIKHIRSQQTVLDNIATVHAHDIRGPVARVLGLAQLFNHENLSDPVNKELIQAIHTVSLQLDEIVKGVIQQSSSKT